MRVTWTTRVYVPEEYFDQPGFDPMLSEVKHSGEVLGVVRGALSGTMLVVMEDTGYVKEVPIYDVKREGA